MGSAARDRHDQALPPAILQDKAAKLLGSHRVQQPLTPQIGPSERRAKVAQSFDDRIALDEVRRVIEFTKLFRPLDDVENGEALVVKVDFAAGEDIDLVSSDKCFEEESASVDVAALLQRPVKLDGAWPGTRAAADRLRQMAVTPDRRMDSPSGFPPAGCKITVTAPVMQASATGIG